MQKSLDPITYEMNYDSGLQNIGASWSSTARYRYCPYSPVVTYTEYTADYPVFEDSDKINNGIYLNEFIEKYPTVTIVTEGGAVSDSTFGDIGRGKFGNLTFSTNNFKHDDFFDVYIVSNHWKQCVFDVGVEISIGFQKSGKILCLRPCVNGWIYSVGAYWRDLKFYLKVKSITFNPK